MGYQFFLRLRQGKDFKNGPFSLGRYSLPVNVVACLWISFISILFILPPLNPVTANNLNYAVVAVGMVLLFSSGWWLISARKWFKGPKLPSLDKVTTAEKIDSGREEEEAEVSDEK